MQDILTFELPDEYQAQIDHLRLTYALRSISAKEVFVTRGFYRTEAEDAGFDFSSMANYINEQLSPHAIELYQETNISIVTTWPGQSYRTHTDTMYVVHVPVTTNPYCHLNIGNELYHFEVGKFYLANTLKQHSAFNLGKTPRTHILLSAKEI